MCDGGGIFWRVFGGVWVDGFDGMGVYDGWEVIREIARTYFGEWEGGDDGGDGDEWCFDVGVGVSVGMGWWRCGDVFKEVREKEREE